MGGTNDGRRDLVYGGSTLGDERAFLVLDDGGADGIVSRRLRTEGGDEVRSGSATVVKNMKGLRRLCFFRLAKKVKIPLAY